MSYREKQVVILKETGKTTADIAEILQISNSTVSTLLNRARSKGYEAVIIIPGNILGVFVGEDDADE